MYLGRRSMVLKDKKSLNRLVSVLPSLYGLPKNETSRAITDAEKIIGYPTSFLNLRWLLSDEVANVAVHLRKLVGTDHPFLKTVKNLIVQNEAPSWGLIVLLISKAGGQNKKFSNSDQDTVSGVLHSQRILAEVTEMIRTSNQFHKGLLNIDASTENESDMNFGNKIALLCGDYLLSSSFHELACIKNDDLNELMSSALRDLAECEFVGPRDKQNKPMPVKPDICEGDIEIPDEYGTEPLNMTNILGKAKSEWIFRNILGGASLLGKSCQGTLMLAGHGKNFQRVGYKFGKHYALTYQAFKDLQSIYDKKSFSLVSAPVLFHLQCNPDLYFEIEHIINRGENVDCEKLRDIIKYGPGMEKTRSLQQEQCQLSLRVLEDFPHSEAKIALINILNEIKVL